LERWKNGILWVDDNPVTHIILRQDFEKLNVWINFALTTDEALTRLSQERFGVIISDIRFGEERYAGYVLLNALRDRQNNTPLFFFSGSASRPDRRATALAGGALGSISDPEELFDEVMGVFAVGQAAPF
jgi:CheY-like chemotaxis protein